MGKQLGRTALPAIQNCGTTILLQSIDEPILRNSMSLIRPNTSHLYLECFVLFVGLPLAIYSVEGAKLIHLTLWIISLSCCFYLLKQPGFDKSQLINTEAVTLSALRLILLRFMLVAPAIVAFTYYYHHERLFSLVNTQPLAWLLIILLYPILSVYPQELLYRLYFFTRYRPIFQPPWLMITVNSLLFGYAHIVFNNWISVTFTFAGGIMFAYTYHRHRSLLLASIEHALYGCFVFTIGLGWFFYHAAER